jgi:hypothetical protein
VQINLHQHSMCLGTSNLGGLAGRILGRYPLWAPCEVSAPLWAFSATGFSLSGLDFAHAKSRQAEACPTG